LILVPTDSRRRGDHNIWWRCIEIHSPEYAALAVRLMCPSPPSLLAKCRSLHDFSRWAMLDMNQRPPPCKGEEGCFRVLPSVVKIRSPKRIFLHMVAERCGRLRCRWRQGGVKWHRQHARLCGGRASPSSWLGGRRTGRGILRGVPALLFANFANGPAR
jgi:hypothetical protein